MQKGQILKRYILIRAELLKWLLHTFTWQAPSFYGRIQTYSDHNSTTESRRKLATLKQRKNIQNAGKYSTQTSKN